MRESVRFVGVVKAKGLRCLLDAGSGSGAGVGAKLLS